MNSFLKGVRQTPVPATLSALEASRNARHTAPLQQLPVLSSEQTPSTAPLSTQVTEGAREMAQQGVNAVFRTLPWATDQKIMSQMERRDRVVFLLLDSRRSIQDIARLVNRNELDIARTIVRLLKCGYIEPAGALGTLM